MHHHSAETVWDSPEEAELASAFEKAIHAEHPHDQSQPVFQSLEERAAAAKAVEEEADQIEAMAKQVEADMMARVELFVQAKIQEEQSKWRQAQEAERAETQKQEEARKLEEEKCRQEEARKHEEENRRQEEARKLEEDNRRQEEAKKLEEDTLRQIAEDEARVEAQKKKEQEEEAYRQEQAKIAAMKAEVQLAEKLAAERKASAAKKLKDQHENTQRVIENTINMRIAEAMKQLGANGTVASQGGSQSTSIDSTVVNQSQQVAPSPTSTPLTTTAVEKATPPAFNGTLASQAGSQPALINSAIINPQQQVPPSQTSTPLTTQADLKAKPLALNGTSGNQGGSTLVNSQQQVAPSPANTHPFTPAAHQTSPPALTPSPITITQANLSQLIEAALRNSNILQPQGVVGSATQHPTTPPVKPKVTFTSPVINTKLLPNPTHQTNAGQPGAAHQPNQNQITHAATAGQTTQTTTTDQTTGGQPAMNKATAQNQTGQLQDASTQPGIQVRHAVYSAH